MKQLIILAILATAALAAKVPVVVDPVAGVPVKVTTPVPVVQPVEQVQHPVAGGQHVQQVPSVPPHVQHAVQQAHQHIQQVVNHHVAHNKNKEQLPAVGEPPAAVHHHHVHVDVVQHHANGQQHAAHTHHVAGEATPQHVVDKINKVEQHVHQVMQQAHQHIPQVINHQIAEKQKHKQQQQQQQGGAVSADKVPVGTLHPKTTSM